MNHGTCCNYNMHKIGPFTGSVANTSSWENFLIRYVIRLQGRDLMLAIGELAGARMRPCACSDHLAI